MRQNDSANELEPGEQALKAAPVFRRVTAGLIDYAIIYSFTFILGLLGMILIEEYIVCGHLSYAPSGEIATCCAAGVLIVVAFFWQVMYFAWFESSKRQATPGKMASGLQAIGLPSHEISFGKALWKSSVQLCLLELLNTIVSIPFAIADTIVPAKCWQIVNTVFFLALAAAIFCKPVFRSGKQTVLDLVSARMVVSRSDLHELIPGSPKRSLWNFLRIALGGLISMATAIGLVICVPSNYVLIEKSIEAVPIAEKAFKLDLSCQNEQARRLIEEARKKFPHLYLMYGNASNCAVVFGMDQLKQDLSYKSLVLVPENKDDPAARSKYLKSRSKQAGAQP